MKYSYIYTPGGQILAQQAYNAGAEPNEPNEMYFYIHDRLGSVRLVISDAADVNNSYTYSPSGEMFASECTETIYNPFLFTGQLFDREIQQYYLRARMYCPYLGIFTSRDPVMGKFQEPLTLHVYLYCGNDPLNRTDRSGKISAALIVIGGIAGGISAAITSGCDEWSDVSSIAFGIATGMFAGMLPNTFLGYMGGIFLSMGNTTYSTYFGGGDMENLGINLFFNAAGAGMGGPIGALAKNAGFFGYLGSQSVGMFYSWMYGETYEGGKSIIERPIEDITPDF